MQLVRAIKAEYYTVVTCWPVRVEEHPGVPGLQVGFPVPPRAVLFLPCPLDLHELGLGAVSKAVVPAGEKLGG